MHCRYEGRIWNFVDHCFVGEKRPARCGWASRVTVAIWGLTGLRLAGASPVCPFACLPVRPPARPSRRSLARQLARPPARPRLRQLYRIWLPPWTAFHVSCSICITGPPDCSGFPYTQHQPSGKAASIYMFFVEVGLPHCRASQVYTIRPPAWTGFHAPYRVFITGPPALSGFPHTHHKASDTDRLPCLSTSY